MQTSNGDPNIRSNRPEWNLLAEYVLSEIKSNNDDEDELTEGWLVQPFGELGLPPESAQSIQMALTGSVKETLAHLKQGGLEGPGRLRVFCQKKLSDDANSVKASRPVYSEQTMEHAPIKYHSSTVMNGGWGYFVIERSGDGAGPLGRARPVVDLYLYKEGE